jgi:PAS domain S-box-containing protein
MYGFDKVEDLIEKSIFELIAANDRKKAEQYFKKTSEIGITREILLTLLKKDGSLFPAEICLALIKDHSDKPAGFIIVSRDISQRKKMENKIQNYQEKLRALASQLSLTKGRERHNIASLLHDQIGQKLSLAKIKLGAISKSLLSAPEHEKPLKEIRELIEEIIQNTRMLTFELSPPILYELGLEPSIEWLAEQFSEKHDLEVEFNTDKKAKPLDEDIRNILFQAVRELLINVVKHAKATIVKVSIKRDRGKIQVTVEDNGIGFDPSVVHPYSLKTGGFGLFNIRERLEEFGGHLDIISSVGQGTRVSLIAPLST